MRYYNHEVLVFHILDKQEIELNYNEKMIFEDLENQNQITTEPWQIKKSYMKEMKERVDYFKAECSTMNINYNLNLQNRLFLHFYQTINYLHH